MTLTDPVSDRLLKSSARHSYDPVVDIDWEAPLVDGLWFMQPERMSLYGTPTWDALSEEQRIELSRHEVASQASVGLWFELILMQVMLRDLYDEDPRSQRMHYALTEIADECRHSLMFGKMIDRVGAPAYGPAPRIHRMGRLMRVLGTGVGAYASILVAEEILDRWQREVIEGRAGPATRPDGQPDPRPRGGTAHHLCPRPDRTAAAGAQQGPGGLAPGADRTDRSDGVPGAGQPAGVRVRRPRPGRGPEGGAGQPALPGHPGVDGGAGHRLPRRARPDPAPPARGSGDARC